MTIHLERSEDLIAEQMADAMEGRCVIQDALIVISVGETASYVIDYKVGAYVTMPKRFIIPRKMYLADIVEVREKGFWFFRAYDETIRVVTGHKIRKMKKKFRDLAASYKI